MALLKNMLESRKFLTLHGMSTGNPDKVTSCLYQVYNRLKFVPTREAWYKLLFFSSGGAISL
ncbi:MAG: hypothetical protein IPM42_07235 [Saprospiraceae bacterium]|nr:hypothetical protein [Saprospiraceae bacterium]